MSQPPPALFEGSPEEWDDFARRQVGFTHFHRYGWRDLIQSRFGHRCDYLALRDGELRAVLPLVEVRSRLFGRYLMSMPFLNYGGPLGDNEACTALIQYAVKLARSRGTQLLELRSARPLETDLPVSHRKLTVVLTLADSRDALWSGLKSKVRSQVRRPRKEGVEVRFGPTEWRPFFEIYSEHMRDLGTPGLPAAWFRELTQRFGESCWFGVAYRGDLPVAGGCGFRWGDEFEMTWASALRAHSRIAPNMLVYWEFMERALESGARRFNFGRCTPGGGTHRFKRQWGGEDESLWWYQWASGGRSATPSPDDGALAWGPRLWRRLPVPVARMLGPRIVRYLP